MRMNWAAFVTSVFIVLAPATFAAAQQTNASPSAPARSPGDKPSASFNLDEVAAAIDRSRISGGHVAMTAGPLATLSPADRTTAIMHRHMLRCWTQDGVPHDAHYDVTLELTLNRDGSIASGPRVIRRATDPHDAAM